MPVCPTRWLNSFDHKRVQQVTDAKETALLLTNGTKVKHIWSDAFSTYLSASLASLRLSTGLNLNVFPPHVHSSNPAENCIRNSTRSSRKVIANLVGTVAQGKA